MILFATRPSLVGRLACRAVAWWLASTLLLVSTAHVQAEDPHTPARTLTTSTGAPAGPFFPIVASLPRPAAKPPLPFAGPLVGPLIKRVPMNDLDRRTTAFFPTQTDLARLTPIEPPAETRWIRVDLSEQLAVVYENSRPLRGFVISSGLPGTPTVEGEFRIRTKVRVQTLSGGSGEDAYSVPNVEWIQYFYSDYGFHNTYWHSDFGKPMSRGCINMTTADAKWLFDWAGPTWDGRTNWFSSTKSNPGTLVVVHE